MLCLSHEKYNAMKSKSSGSRKTVDEDEVQIRDEEVEKVVDDYDDRKQ
jgi:hypothetical protein